MWICFIGLSSYPLIWLIRTMWIGILSVRSFVTLVLGQLALSEIYKKSCQRHMAIPMCLSSLQIKKIHCLPWMNSSSKPTNEQKQRSIGLAEVLVAERLFIQISTTPCWNQTASTITCRNQKAFKKHYFVERWKIELWAKQRQSQEYTKKKWSKLIYLQMHWLVYLLLVKYVSLPASCF